MMLPSIQVMGDVFLSRTDMIWILAEMDDAREAYTAKRIMGQAGEKGSWSFVCRYRKQEARLLHFRTKQLDTLQNKRVKQCASMTMVVTSTYTVLWGKSCFYGYMDRLYRLPYSFAMMNEFWRQ